MGNKTSDEPTHKHNEYSEFRNRRLFYGQQFEITGRDASCKEANTQYAFAINLKRTLRKMNKNTNSIKVTSRSAKSLFLLLRIPVYCFIFIKQWIILCLLISCACAYREQKFAIEPQDQSAVVGSRVTLPCRVEGKVGQLQWTKDDFGLGTHRHLTGYERYKMVGSDEEGDYSLDIREVTLDDDASYQCQVSSGPRGEPPIRSRYARLTVLVSPDPPRILQGPLLQAIEDQEIDLECVSIGGKPAAEITWVDHDGGVLTQGVTYTVEQMSDGRRFTARSVLHLRPKRNYHNQSFTCQAQNTADRAYRASNIKLQVQYAPRVRIFTKSGVKNSRVQEGDNLILGCQATANPNNLTYKWFVNSDQIIGNVSNEIVISNVSRKYNEATVKCEVHNVVGKSADSKTLEVAYGPKFKIKPLNVEGDSGSIATMNCIVDGHPQPKITWLRYENDRVIRVGKSSNLTVTVSKQSAGQYWCRASVEGYQDIEAPAMVFVKGPPKIVSNKTQYGVEGDSVRIECISFSVPKPDFVIWTFGGNEINSFHNHEYAFLEETLTDRMTKSTLIIRESQSKHFGTYNCNVSNSYGTDSYEIDLIPDKSFNLLIVICGAAAAAILILIVMLFIMLCHRKSNKTDVKKPDITDIGKTCVDQFKDSDRSSNISDIKMELRQVEGSCDMGSNKRGNENEIDPKSDGIRVYLSNEVFSEDNSNHGSESELHSTLHLTTNLGLPLAGPVPLPDAGYDNELMKQYQRYSGDFNQPLGSLHIKAQGQSNGYVPYVDYSRDYAPPLQSSDSLSGSLSRSTDESTYLSHCGSLRRQSSSGRLAGIMGPDLIPMANPGVVLSGSVDVRYAATYGNPYLRASGPLSYVQHAGTGPTAKPAPPPYYTLRSTNHTQPAPGVISPSSSSSSRPVTSPLASSSSTNSGAQPQVPKASPQSSGALYILPPSSQGNIQSCQITTKGNGSRLAAGTHV